MKPLLLTLMLLSAIATGSYSQVLFTYGKDSVTTTEFLRAFNKVGLQEGQTRDQAIRNYLDLFINSKLKVKEAYAQGIDSMPSFRDEMITLRSQIVDNYMNDPTIINKLVDEAFARSQKDILIAHIFIPNSAEAEGRIKKAHEELTKGVSFETVALKYSGDSTVKKNKGLIGFITVFSLPYEFENIVYSLSPGKFSRTYKSRIGWHIFKNVRQRPAVGRIKASQILLAYFPGITEAEKKRINQRADSIHRILLKGGDFAKLAKEFSNDYISASAEGMMPEFGVGAYDPVFENAAFALQKDGAFSSPVISSHGVHIIKRNAHTPVSKTKDKQTLEIIRHKVENDARIGASKSSLYDRVIQTAGFRETNFNRQELYAYADSLIQFRKPDVPVVNLKEETPIFKLGDKIRTVRDYLEFASNNRVLPNNAGYKSYEQLYEELKQVTAFEYYRDNLEHYNPEFRAQMNDFREGNLFFEIMMQEIWSRAQNDSVGQMRYYQSNRNSFRWNNSADAVIFYCGDVATCTQLHDLVAKDKANWKNIQLLYADRSTVDSGRFELDRIPGLKNTTLTINSVSNPQINKEDNSVSFAYILRLYPQPEQKSFREARSEVISGYQSQLDAEWIAALRKKYEVRVNQEELKKIL